MCLIVYISFGSYRSGLSECLHIIWLLQEWVDDKKRRRLKHRYVWKEEDFRSVDTSRTDYLLGKWTARVQITCWVSGQLAYRLLVG